MIVILFPQWIAVIRIFIQAEKKMTVSTLSCHSTGYNNLDVFYYISGTSTFTVERTFS